MTIIMTTVMTVPATDTPIEALPYFLASAASVGARLCAKTVHTRTRGRRISYTISSLLFLQCTRVSPMQKRLNRSRHLLEKEQLESVYSRLCIYRFSRPICDIPDTTHANSRSKAESDSKSLPTKEHCSVAGKVTVSQMLPQPSQTVWFIHLQTQ